MNKRFFFLSFLLTSFFIKAWPSPATEPAKEEKETNVEQNTKESPSINKISEAFGHLIGKNLESLGFEFNMNQVVKGLQDACTGKTSPMDEAECVQAISLVQEAAFQKLADSNLAEAEAFLKKNAQEEGVIELEKGKLQYKLEKQEQEKLYSLIFLRLSNIQAIF